MSFAPRPTESFLEFIQTYYARCRERVPSIEANAGKWSFEDLIPGLSDFDTRFIVRDGMTAEDWCRMSTDVGEVHLELVRERRDWARTLEHLPGVNLEWSELLDPRQYFSEFSKWSFYCGPVDRIDTVKSALAAHRWNIVDETYHWKVLATYYGPYDRSIDPPINLGPFANKYPLHSRLMHYFAPPVMAGVALHGRKTIPGKLDALRRARELFPDAQTMDLVLDLVARHYEEPEVLIDPGLANLERRLEVYLTKMVDALRADLPEPAFPSTPTAAQLKQWVKAWPNPAPLALLFENIKFARLMKGRLWFYGQEVLWFDSLSLIPRELVRIRTNFYETPLRLFGRQFLGREMTAEETLEAIQGEVLDRTDVEACRRFAAESRRDQPIADYRRKALEIAACFDPFLHGIEKLRQAALNRVEESRIDEK